MLCVLCVEYADPLLWALRLESVVSVLEWLYCPGRRWVSVWFPRTPHAARQLEAVVLLEGVGVASGEAGVLALGASNEGCATFWALDSRISRSWRRVSPNCCKAAVSSEASSSVIAVLRVSVPSFGPFSPETCSGTRGVASITEVVVESESGAANLP